MKGTRLSKDSQQMKRAHAPAPVQNILDASDTELFSYQPTQLVATARKVAAVAGGETVPTQVGMQDFHRSQALMLLLSAFSGLLIGIAIAIFVL